MARRTPKPTAVPVKTVCSLCGLGWEEHGEEPTAEDCIRLLKAELARKPVSIPQPYAYPYPYPYPRKWPYYWESGTMPLSKEVGTKEVAISYGTPRLIAGKPKPSTG